jgi:hypothetical protein
MLISIGEYARKHNVSHDTIKRGCQIGRFQTAQKIGKNWAIDSEESFVDNRFKNGKYVGWRKKSDK